MPQTLEERIKAGLGNIRMPCYLVGYGKDRTRITKYNRAEYSSVFVSSFVEGLGSVGKIVEMLDAYQGPHTDIDLIALSLDNEGSLQETIL